MAEISPQQHNPRTLCLGDLEPNSAKELNPLQLDFSLPADWHHIAIFQIPMGCASTTEDLVSTVEVPARESMIECT